MEHLCIVPTSFHDFSCEVIFSEMLPAAGNASSSHGIKTVVRLPSHPQRVTIVQRNARRTVQLPQVAVQCTQLSRCEMMHWFDF